MSVSTVSWWSFTVWREPCRIFFRTIYFLLLLYSSEFCAEQSSFYALQQNLPVNLKQCPVISLCPHVPALKSLPPSLPVPAIGFISLKCCSLPSTGSPNVLSWAANATPAMRHQQLARQTWGTSLRGPQNLCAQFPQQLQPLFMNKRDQTRAYIYNHTTVTTTAPSQ